MTNNESSEKLIGEADRICRRDLKGALDENDYNKEADKDKKEEG